MVKTNHSINAAITAGALLTLCGTAFGQFTSNFEPPLYVGAPAGVSITTPPQDAWYVPVVGSEEASVWTHVGNTLLIPANPAGGVQFEGGATHPPVPPETLTLVRAQHDVDFSAGGIWELTYDGTGAWTLAVPSADNLGSFSMQPSGTARYFQTLMTWGATAVGPVPNATNWTATADHFHIAIGHFTIASPAAIIFDTPGPAWRDLLVGHWYRSKVLFDFTASNILQCSIQDLTTGGCVTTVNTSALGWTLQGGAPSANPLPTAIRFFTGGGSGATPGNVTAYDNFSIAPAAAAGAGHSAACYANCDGSTTVPCLNVLDFGCFLNAFASNDCYANCDNSTTAPVLNVLDFGCFLNSFAAGCSSC